MFRANFCPSLGAQDWGIFTTCGIVSCCCDRQLPSYRTCSATFPRSELLPTTTTGHYTIFCKKSQSCAPEDGQNFARNMLSWSWRSIKLLLLHLVGFLYYFTYIASIFFVSMNICFSHPKRSSRTSLPTLTLRLWENLSRLSSSWQTSPVSEPRATSWDVTVV